MTAEIKTIEKIRASYTEKETSNFDELLETDKKAKRPAKIFAYVFGTSSALILGTGMSFAMKAIGASLSFAMPLGVGVGILGLLLASVNYPIYKRFLQKRKDRYASRIFELSNSLLNQ